jgi:hypothetical protein
MLPVDQNILDEWLGPRVDVKPIYDCKTLHDRVELPLNCTRKRVVQWRLLLIC